VREQAKLTGRLTDFLSAFTSAAQAFRWDNSSSAAWMLDWICWLRVRSAAVAAVECNLQGITVRALLLCSCHASRTIKPQDGSGICQPQQDCETALPQQTLAFRQHTKQPAGVVLGHHAEQSAGRA
jgi:hypothetical protein